MALKELLVQLNQAEGVDSRLRLAMSLATRHECRLTALFVEEWNEAQSAARATAEMGLAAARALDELDFTVNCEIRRAGSRLWNELQRFQCVSGLSAQWHHVRGFCDAAVRRYSPLSDLCILGHEGLHTVQSDWSLCESMLLSLGTPILYVPKVTSVTTLGSRILVVWDGSRAAARALNDALTLIDRSDYALILNVDSGLHEQSTTMLSRLAERLRKHCASADFAQIQAAPKMVADVLQATAGEMGADLIVTGAYTNSRLKERLFGGVTRSLLQRTRFPLLMSH
ncbi:MAG TPA: universal stress protein [Steroidobacteraceae bacterium]